MTKPANATTPKLSNVDFRFISAWVQGIDVGHGRCTSCTGPGDMRRIRNTTRLLMDLLAGIGKRHGCQKLRCCVETPRIASMNSGATSLTSSTVAMNHRRRR
jgi:hypothetical protein